MTIILRVSLIIITLIYMFLLIKSIRNKKIQVSFSTFWILSGVVLLIAVAVPNLIEFISSFLGFWAPSNMVFCITIFISYYLIFQLTMKLSNEHKKNVTLVQELSLLKNRVEILERKDKE